jgi:hypothetical protein
MGGMFGRVCRTLPRQAKFGGISLLAAGAVFAASIAGVQSPAFAGSDASSDTYAGDYGALALPAGTLLVLDYVGFQNATGYNQNANNILGKFGYPVHSSASVTLYTDITRLTYFTTLFGKPLILEGAFDAVAVGGNPTINGVPQSSKSGLGDTVLFATLGLVVDPANQHYVGITDYNIIPTGIYDKFANINPFTAGQYTNVPQIGITEGLTKYGLRNFWFDFIGNVSIHSDGGAPVAVAPLGGAQFNKVTQDTSYDIKAFLRYDFAQSFWVAAGIEKSWGGNQTASGGGLGTLVGPRSLGTDEFTKLHLQGSVPITRDFHAAVDITHAFDVNGGLKEDFGVELRLTKFFLPTAPMEALK